MELKCPKCHGAMRSYERSGILIDQCTECRGVFLDRGELDKLIDAEAEHQQASATTASPATQRAPWGSPQGQGYEERHPDDSPYRDDRYRDDRDRDDRDRDDRDRDDRYRDRHRYDDHRYGKKRKHSFLDELFD